MDEQGLSYDRGIEEEALPEPRLVKRIIIKRLLILNNRLDSYRNELPFGSLILDKKKLFCNSLLTLYETLRPKLKDKWNKSTYKTFKKLEDLDKYCFDSFKMVEEEKLKDLVKFKLLLEDFIECIGITKIEVSKEGGDLLRRK